MRVIETTAHVGSDGMLRLEVPMERRDQDVHVALVVESVPTRALTQDKTTDRWASIRSAVEGTGIRLPSPGIDNAGAVEAVVLPGPSASELLINDRR